MIFPKTELLPMLMEESLWLVMDPWRFSTESNDTGLAFKSDILSWYYMNKIIYYTADIKYKCISSKREIAPLFLKWINLKKPKDLHNFMTKNKLTKITYCGFNHGKCIVFSDVGARDMAEFYDCYLKHDLSFIGIHDTDCSLDFYNPDRKSLKYMTFV